MSREIELVQLVGRIAYKPGYRIVVSQNDRWPTIQVEFDRPDTFTGELGVGRSRAVDVTPEMTDGDVVRTAFGLLAAIEEHECREAFTVDGIRVFGPHIELGALLEAGRHVQGAAPMDPVEAAPSCRHEESLYGRCTACGMTWEQQAELDPAPSIPKSWDLVADADGMIFVRHPNGKFRELVDNGEVYEDSTLARPVRRVVVTPLPGGPREYAGHGSQCVALLLGNEPEDRVLTPDEARTFAAELLASALHAESDHG